VSGRRLGPAIPSSRFRREDDLRAAIGWLGPELCWYVRRGVAAGWPWGWRSAACSGSWLLGVRHCVGDSDESMMKRGIAGEGFRRDAIPGHWRASLIASTAIVSLRPGWFVLFVTLGVAPASAEFGSASAEFKEIPAPTLAVEACRFLAPPADSIWMAGPSAGAASKVPSGRRCQRCHPAHRARFQFPALRGSPVGVRAEDSNVMSSVKRRSASGVIPQQFVPGGLSPHGLPAGVAKVFPTPRPPALKDTWH